MEVLEEDRSTSPGLALIRIKKQVIQAGKESLTKDSSRKARARGRKRSNEEMESRRV
jgi:hypothetical protein